MNAKSFVHFREILNVERIPLSLPHINGLSLKEALGKGNKIVSEYDQEIPQSQTADKPMALRGRATQQLRDTRKTN